MRPPKLVNTTAPAVEPTSVLNDPLYLAHRAFRALGTQLYDKSEEAYKAKDFERMLDWDLVLLFHWSHGSATLQFGPDNEIICIAFKHESANLPPGLLHRAAKSINYLSLAETDVQHRFLSVGALSHSHFTDHIPIDQPASKRPIVWHQLAPYVSSGTRWKPRGQIEQSRRE